MEKTKQNTWIFYFHFNGETRVLQRALCKLAEFQPAKVWGEWEKSEQVGRQGVPCACSRMHQAVWKADRVGK